MRTTFLAACATLIPSLAIASPITGASFGSPAAGGTCGGSLSDGQVCLFDDEFNPQPSDPSRPAAAWDIDNYRATPTEAIECLESANVWTANGYLTILPAEQSASCITAANTTGGGAAASYTSGYVSWHSQTISPPATITARANLASFAGNWTTLWMAGYQCQRGQYWGLPGILWPAFHPGFDVTSPLPLGGSSICGWDTPNSAEIDINEFVPGTEGMHNAVHLSTCDPSCLSNFVSYTVGWHTLQLVWVGGSSPSLTYKVDGTTTSTTTGITNVPTSPMFLLIGTDLGASGSFAGPTSSPRIMADPGGRVTIATGATTFAYSQSQSFSVGDQLIFNSQPGVLYAISSGSGQFWSLATPYTGPASGLNGTAAIHQSALAATFGLTSGSVSVQTSADVRSGSCPQTTNTTCVGDTISFGPQPGNWYTITAQTSSSLTLDHGWAGATASGVYGDDIATNLVDYVRVTSP